MPNWSEQLGGSEFEWLGQFGSDPDNALDRLLRGEVIIEGFGAEDPAVVLVDWAIALLDEEQFVPTLDAALARWIVANSGFGDELSEAPRLADAWIRASAVLLDLPELRAASEALQALVSNWEQRFESVIAMRGPEFAERFLSAAAVTQVDRTLAPMWWRLCALSEGTPPRLGAVGVLGLQHLPPDEGEERGGFRRDLVAGLIAYADGLRERVKRGFMQERSAYELLASAVDVFQVSYPFPEVWHAALRQEAAGTAVEEWIAEYTQSAPAGSTAAGGDERSEERVVGWGDLQDFVRDLIDQAVAVRETNPEEAVRLSREAIRWAPWDPFGWSNFVRATRNLRGAAAALPAAWAATERFPEDAVCWQELATFLAESGKNSLAEEVWREILMRFPDDEPSINTFAKFLATAGRLYEALDIIEPAARLAPANDEFQITLADIYRRLEKFDQSEALLRPHVESDGPNPYFWSALLRLLRDSEREAEARALRARARSRFPKVRYFKDFRPVITRQEESAALSGQGSSASASWDTPTLPAELRVLRRRVERQDADARAATGDYERLLELLSDGRNDRIGPTDRVAEYGLLLLAGGHTEKALDQLQRGSRTFRYSLRVSYALSRAARVAALTEEARYTPALTRKLNAPLDQIRRQDSGVRPLLRLHAVRAAYALRDGVALEERRADLTARLYDEVQAPEWPGRRERFSAWWGRSVRRELEKALSADGESCALVADGHALNTLEEDFAGRLTTTTPMDM